MKLLIVSDTHGLNIDKLIETIKKENADINIHAGDYLLPIDKMKKVFQYFVDGNNDYGYEDEQTFIIDGFKFLLIHGHQYFGFNYEN
jgi:putative phosphoesterase